MAGDYERYRPGYPDRFVQAILDYAEPPVLTAIEIGAGTGKATRSFAEHRSIGPAGNGQRIAVTAVDPDRAMLAELDRQTAGLPVTTICATLEALPATGPFDLLYAASAWHWTDPDTRWQLAAHLVRPGGTVAFFDGGRRLIDDRIADALTAARRTMLSDEKFRRPGSESIGPNWVLDGLRDAPQFVDATERILTDDQTIPAADFVGLLSTQSSYLQLAPADRAEVLRRIEAVLPPEVDVHRELGIQLARRASDPAER
ncbi:MAG: class I SAM-dependent methyltransferase [Actinomycetota bacterium]|nr:class I SAM-dependent methyltransferase [Actinomycetota bacterium]